MSGNSPSAGRSGEKPCPTAAAATAATRSSGTPPSSMSSGSWPDGSPNDSSPIRASSSLGHNRRGLRCPGHEPRAAPVAPRKRGGNHHGVEPTASVGESFRSPVCPRERLRCSHDLGCRMEPAPVTISELPWARATPNRHPGGSRGCCDYFDYRLVGFPPCPWPWLTPVPLSP